MFSNILKLFKTNYGKNIISIILGLGLASLFRNICKNRNCMDFYGPDIGKLENTTYKYNDKCYNFSHTNVVCDNNKHIVSFKIKKTE